ncbi:hypothetical protein [Gloeothece verrucosa]|uniref:Uncharacterized protein n=1 Tax=Gloeothece verrucosa (strain PCC 7822) TaxID=497965 RepID=E0U811_GLOV7|nr:hypothetical protein [Gloeothece verrucosa]ADN16098.1 conserved hypothetical protein [Gloeothece verrucosa PCC 7822]
MAEPFRFANGQLAYTVADLKKISEQFPQDSINYLVRGDFENWLNYIGDSKAAQQAREARQANLNDQDRLKKFLKGNNMASSVATEAKPTQTQPTVTTSPEKSSQEDNPLAQLFKSFSKLFGGS